MLAVVCGDGSCKVLVLPTSADPDQQDRPASGIPVIDEKQLCRFTLLMPTLSPNTDRVLITCAEWQTAGRLVCGTASGHVTTWYEDILLENTLLKFCEMLCNTCPGLLRLIPFVG